MTEYANNCPISRPIKLGNLVPEVDLNGVMFSYTWGLVYNPTEDILPLRLPSPE